jgi:hypothetical protein
MLNVHFISTNIGGRNLCFSSPKSVENNCCSGFSRTGCRKTLLQGPNPTLTLVANSKMGAMILFTPASEDQRHKVDSCAETTTSVGKSRLERIRHQCQCWVWAFNATPQAALPTTLWGGSLPLHIFGRLRQALRRVCPRGRAIARGRGTRPWGMREGVEGWRGLASLVGYGPEVRSWSPAPS